MDQIFGKSLLLQFTFKAVGCLPRTLDIQSCCCTRQRTDSFKLCLPAYFLWDLRTFILSFLISSAFEKVIWKIFPCWFSVGSSEDYSGRRNTNVNVRKQYDYNSSALRDVTVRLPTESLCFSFSLNDVFLSREVINFAFHITSLVYFSYLMHADYWKFHTTFLDVRDLSSPYEQGIFPC